MQNTCILLQCNANVKCFSLTRGYSDHTFIISNKTAKQWIYKQGLTFQTPLENIIGIIGCQIQQMWTVFKQKFKALTIWRRAAERPVDPGSDSLGVWLKKDLFWDLAKFHYLNFQWMTFGPVTYGVQVYWPLIAHTTEHCKNTQNNTQKITNLYEITFQQTVFKVNWTARNINSLWTSKLSYIIAIFLYEIKSNF